MGTRGLLGLIIKAQRHGFYNHDDSYPSGLGNAIVKFLQSLKDGDCATMSNLVKDIIWVDGDSSPTPELQNKYSEAGFSDIQVSNRTLEDWYCLLHKLQNGKVLQAVQNGQVQHLTDMNNFLEDGLFCEWAYFIDFENQKLETWSAGEMIDVATFSKVVQDGPSYIEALEKGPGDEEGEEEEESSAAARA